METALIWFRQDLRLAANRALVAACAASERLLPVYVHAPAEHGDWPPGAASRWWLHHSLLALRRQLRARGSDLLVRHGNSAEQLLAPGAASGARRVYCQRLYEPALAERDRAVAGALEAAGIELFSLPGSLLNEPWRICSGSGQPYRRFTPYWRTARSRLPVEPPQPTPRLPPLPQGLATGELAALELLPRSAWDGGLAAAWQPGEAGALQRLEQFLATALSGYDQLREPPARAGTSRLSPHLHFGEISPQQIFWAVEQARQDTAGAGAAIERFEAELGWREFAHHLLHHAPTSASEPLDARFRRFPWHDDADALRAWQQGRTGIPLVDAGMRELWHTGWMHNRVRMVAASFLVKNLRQPWQAGARWFWDTLVDADLANNSLGWQWVAGCGADAAPYFRIFNPVLQGQKFDPDGAYVRRWVPELAGLPNRYLQRPWEAPAAELRRAGIELGRHYPLPLVDLAASRQAALDAFASLR